MAIHTTQNASDIVSFDEWLSEISKTRVTGFRWRKAGHIKTVNIFGRLYVTRDEIAAFEKRAINGDFSREAKTAKASASRN